MERDKTTWDEVQLYNARNLKRKKVLRYINKKNAKRLVSFAGFVAKLKQAMSKQDSSFVYYTSKRIDKFLALLQACGVVHSFYLMPLERDRKTWGIKVGPTFLQRVLLVYLKPPAKFGEAVSTIKMFSVPSRGISITYGQLVAKAVGAGATTMYVLNTSKGLLTHSRALQYKIGGELVCEIR